MKKLLLSLLLISIVSVKALEPAQIVAQAKPVLIKNAIDKSVEFFKYLTDTKVCKFLIDNKVTNTITQDEYVQNAWSDKLGKSVLIAAPFYLIALSKMNNRPSGRTTTHYTNGYIEYSGSSDKQINQGFSALNYAIIGAIVQATTYAYLNK